ncbi:MAG TPA: hypothetical protein PK363_04195 [Giesbergeria sp.]|nr:hypothetical protein [Giesbergeria sp.]
MSSKPLPEPMTWTVDVSLLGSPVVLRQTAGVFLVTFAVVSLFACGIFAVEGDWAGILPTLGVLALVHVGLVLGALAVMVLYFGNRIAMEFTVDERGVFSQVRDRKAHKASQLAVVLGLATGRFTVAGAGLLARSGASSFVPWKAVQRVRCDEARHTIHLDGGWRTRAALFCTPQNYHLARTWALRMCPST